MTDDDIWKANMIQCHERSLDQPLSRRFYLYYLIPQLKYQALADLASISTTMCEILDYHSDEYVRRNEIYERILKDLELLCEL